MLKNLSHTAPVLAPVIVGILGLCAYLWKDSPSWFVLGRHRWQKLIATSSILGFFAAVGGVYLTADLPWMNRLAFAWTVAMSVVVCVQAFFTDTRFHKIDNRLMNFVTISTILLNVVAIILHSTSCATTGVVILSSLWPLVMVGQKFIGSADIKTLMTLGAGFVPLLGIAIFFDILIISILLFLMESVWIYARHTSQRSFKGYLVSAVEAPSVALFVLPFVIATPCCLLFG